MTEGNDCNDRSHSDSNNDDNDSNGKNSNGIAIATAATTAATGVRFIKSRGYVGTVYFFYQPRHNGTPWSINSIMS